MAKKRAARRRCKLSTDIRRLHVTGSDSVLHPLIGLSAELLLRPSELVTLLLIPKRERCLRMQWIQNAIRAVQADRLRQLSADADSATIKSKTKG